MRLRGIEYCFQHAPYAEAVNEFRENGFRVCSLEDIARLRLAEGRVDGGIILRKKDVKVMGISSNFDEGPIYTRDGILCMPGIKPKAFMVRNIDDLMEKYKDFYGDSEIHPDEKDVKNTLKNSKEYPVIEGSSNGIPFRTIDFGNDELMTFAFGGDKDFARAYGIILNRSDIDEIRAFPAFAEVINNKKYHKGAYIEPVTFGRYADSFEVYVNTGSISRNPELVYGIKDNRTTRNKEVNEFVESLKK